MNYASLKTEDLLYLAAYAADGELPPYPVPEAWGDLAWDGTRFLGDWRELCRALASRLSRETGIVPQRPVPPIPPAVPKMATAYGYLEGQSPHEHGATIVDLFGAYDDGENTFWHRIFLAPSFDPATAEIATCPAGGSFRFHQIHPDHEGEDWTRDPIATALFCPSRSRP